MSATTRDATAAGPGDASMTPPADASGTVSLADEEAIRRILTDTMFGHTFFYDSHPPPRMLDLLAARGFVPVISEFINPPTTGRDKGRYAVVAYRG